ncbi:fimbrial protein [Citrobacter enshiensis]|uniref:fimbrial protein n=1 Tax=Citrobacter enshiensis TaxID=2971264 RepID=UPI0023E8476D|nr:fimbrial protein [Citrobacter enshiensis]WET39918.1 fimbrial protein [Citrobacter enshiensis]
MRFRTLIAASALLLSGTTQADTKLVGGDMYFHGTVVALACSLPPGGDKIEVDFGQIATQDLYSSGRSKPEKFSIQLRDCNPEVFRGISVTFGGTEDAELPDHLALDSSEQGGASGIGIGMSEENGTAIRLGESTSVKEITEGSMTLNFLAWVAAEPTAIKNQSLEYGPFSASGTWTLNYQ